MTRVVWRERQPGTARFARGWWHEQGLGFALGWPAHRVRHLHLRIDAPDVSAREYASIYEALL